MSLASQNQFRVFRNGSRIFGNHAALLEMMPCHHDFLAVEKKKNIKPRPSYNCVIFFKTLLSKMSTVFLLETDMEMSLMRMAARARGIYCRSE